MSEKRKNCEVDTDKKKRRTHKLHTIETKMDIIKRSENGESFASIGRSYDINRSTICSILKNKDKIKEYVKNCGNISSKIISKRHGMVMDKMEKSLSYWISDQNQKASPLSTSSIQAKALSLHEDWKARLKENSDTVFHASNGWFSKFKTRYFSHNIKFTGESADADVDAAKDFVSSLSKIIEDGKYSSSQIFNVNETDLFWKKMPNRTFLSKEESVAPGHKPSKNRLTLLLGGNLAGDLKLMPMLVYQTENPKSLKGKDKKLLPVIWKANKKAWVTALIFKDWFTSYFVPAVKHYYGVNNLPFKALLILDNAPGHPKSLQNLYPEINVVFLPPNTACLTQPMDQTAIVTFKLYYMRSIMKQAIKATDMGGGPTLKDFLKNYNIWNAIENIGNAWAEIKESTMKGSWKKLCPQMMSDFIDFYETPETITLEIVHLMKDLNLYVNSEDVNEVIESHSEPLSNEYLMDQQGNENDIQIESEEDEPEEIIKPLTLKKMNKAFTHLETFLNIMEECDSNGERISQVRRAIYDNTACYRTICEEKKKSSKIQQTLDNFVKKI